MACRRFRFGLLIGCAAALLLLGHVQTTRAGGTPAGVEVDARGVIRRKVFRDATGELTLRRIAEARSTLSSDLARVSPMRKVSLNRLEETVAELISRGETPTDEILFLAGLTRISYVFLYPESGDIVIAGPAEGFAEDARGQIIGIESGRPVMQLQDLIVALRAFPATGHRTDLISVSIDPTREGLERYQQFLAGLGPVRPSDDVRIARGLRDSLGLQQVTVRGVSPKTHFARVLLAADYRMKLIGIGVDKPPVAIRSYVDRANPRDVARNAMQRWYFTPDYECVKVSEDGMAMQLVGNGVKLVGEDERVGPDGRRLSSARTNRASKAFVTEFTRMYSKLAEHEPLYAELRNLIDMLVAAAFIQEEDYYGRADWDMRVFRDELFYPVETFVAVKQAETAVNAVWKGRTLMTPVGGGVNIQPRKALSSEALLADEGEISTARTAGFLDGLAPGQWWWD